jgi:hypothetical protein
MTQYGAGIPFRSHLHPNGGYVSVHLLKANYLTKRLETRNLITCIQSHLNAYARARAHTHTHTHIYIYIHIYIYTYIYICEIKKIKVWKLLLFLYHFLDEHALLITSIEYLSILPDHGRARFLWNIGTHLPNYTAMNMKISFLESDALQLVWTQCYLPITYYGLAVIRTIQHYCMCIGSCELYSVCSIHHLFLLAIFMCY